MERWICVAVVLTEGFKGLAGIFVKRSSEVAGCSGKRILARLPQPNQQTSYYDENFVLLE